MPQPDHAQTSAYPFLTNGGETGELILSYDWDKTAIGPIAQWPQSLRTTLGIILHSAFPQLLFWGDDLICFYNDAFRPSLGVNGKHPGIGKKGTELWADVWQFTGPLMQQVMSTGQPVWFEDQLVPFYRNGRIEDIYWTFSYSPAYGDGGQINGVYVTCTETTAKVIGEERFRVIAEGTDMMISEISINGELTYVNKAWADMTGQTAEDLLKYGWLDLVHPEERGAIKDEYLAAFKNKQPFTIQFRIINTGGDSYHWLQSKFQPRSGRDGKFAGYITSTTDITELKQTEAEQAMLAAIIESSEDAIISKTLNGIITSWNLSAERVFGYTWDEAVGKHISLIIPPDRMDEETLIIEKVRNSEKVDHFETIRTTKSGDPVAISLTVSPIHNKQGKVIGASKIARDISRQRSSEERLQKYAENLEILNTVGQVISEDLDVQNILQKVTDATTQLTGASFGAFFHNMVNEHGESYMLYTLSGAPREAFERFGMPRNTDVFAPTFSGEGIVRVDDITKDPRYGHNSPHKGMPEGHLPVVSYLAVPVISKSGQVIGGLFFGHREAGMFTQEHEQLIAGVAAQAAVALDNAKLYEEIKILNSKKDEFIGLASHELKTPMTSINGYLQLVERSMPLDDRNKGFISKARQQVSKLASLISDLLDVSKIQTGQLPLSFSEFDLRALLTDVIEMMQQTDPSHQLELEMAEQPLMVNADQQRVEQVIINLVSNAAKYSPGKDSIMIKAQAIGNDVQVSVKDHGIGIAQDQHDRIFSRFYRVENLASHMSGLGIGLYISHEIITRHNGKMWLKSKPGQGSEFYFSLPALQ